MTAKKPKNDYNKTSKEPSISNHIIKNSYCLMSSYGLRKKKKNANFISRKDARKLIANNIKIDKNAFNILISDMQKIGLVKNGNRGIYLFSGNCIK